MKIYFVTSSYPRYEGDIAGHFVREQAKAFVRRGDEVTVFTWDCRPKDRDDRVSPLDKGIEVVRVRYALRREDQTLFYGAGTPENLRSNRLNYLHVVPAFSAMVATLLRYPSPDVYYAHWFLPAGVIVAFIGRYRRVPYWIIGHSGGLQLILRLPLLLQRALFRQLLPEVCSSTIASCEKDRIVHSRMSITSSALRDRVPEEVRGTMQVLPMGYSLPEEVKRLLKEKWTLPRRGLRRAIFLGRIVPIKGLEVALEATQRVGMRLDVVGDGPEMNRLKSRYSSELVTFHGRQVGAKKWELLREATISLHPSVTLDGRHEGLPVSLLECAALRCLPLVSGTPGVEDVLGADWQCFPERDVERLETLLRMCNEMSEEELATHIMRQAAIVKKLEWESYIGEWVLDIST